MSELALFPTHQSSTRSLSPERGVSATHSESKLGGRSTPSFALSNMLTASLDVQHLAARRIAHSGAPTACSGCRERRSLLTARLETSLSVTSRVLIISSHRPLSPSSSEQASGSKEHEVLGEPGVTLHEILMSEQTNTAAGAGDSRSHCYSQLYDASHRASVAYLTGRQR